MYPPELVAPMKTELTEAGLQELTTAQEVDDFVASTKGSNGMVVINSVCGCAAGSLRPGVRMALQHNVLPAKMATTFAGVDGEAVAQVRKHMLPYPPSSPSIGIFKDGNLVHMVERHHIEGRTAEMIGEHLKLVFAEL